MHDHLNKEQPDPRRGDRGGWHRTLLEYDMYRSRRTAEAIVAGWLPPGPGPDKLPVKQK